MIPDCEIVAQPENVVLPLHTNGTVKSSVAREPTLPVKLGWMTVEIDPIEELRPGRMRGLEFWPLAVP